jgi:hypothetical protein
MDSIVKRRVTHPEGPLVVETVELARERFLFFGRGRFFFLLPALLFVLLSLVLLLFLFFGFIFFFF